MIKINRQQGDNFSLNSQDSSGRHKDLLGFGKIATTIARGAYFKKIY